MVANNKQKREKCETDLTKFIKVNYREQYKHANPFHLTPSLRANPLEFLDQP